MKKLISLLLIAVLCLPLTLAEADADAGAEKVPTGEKIRKVTLTCTGDALMFRQAGVPVSKYAEEDGMHKSMFFFVGGVTPLITTTTANSI